MRDPVRDVIAPRVSARLRRAYIPAIHCRRTNHVRLQESLHAEPGEALPGRSEPIPTAAEHFVNHHPLKGPYPEGAEKALFGLGCFWGAERKFWELGDGVYVTAVGYAGGVTPNPTYEEVCSGRTGHNEVVLVVYDPKRFPTRRCSRPSGRATTRRKACARATMSAPSTAPASTPSRPRRSKAAEASKAMYEAELKKKGYRPVTTEIVDARRILFRRGLSPAVSGQEPVRLLRARRHRRVVPDRHRRQAGDGLSAGLSGRNREGAPNGAPVAFSHRRASQAARLVRIC